MTAGNTGFMLSPLTLHVAALLVGLTLRLCLPVKDYDSLARQAAFVCATQWEQKKKTNWKKAE